MRIFISGIHSLGTRIFVAPVFILLVFGQGVLFAQQISKTEEDLQRAFLMAQPGDTIHIPAGTFNIMRTLWLDNGRDIVILGAGMEQSILDFSSQVDGAEGIKVTNSSRVTLSSFTVREAKGDGIKVQDTQDLLIDMVRAEWPGKPDKRNGAYGIYPVLCDRVIIQNSEAIGASDAGIYVGQSENIIVKNNMAYFNVAGIEIENSENAEVYNNTALNNTGGILVFDLPDLQKKRGGNVRVYNNIIVENNLKNFAPKGNIVGKVPQGTGVLILATHNVEVFKNEIANNRSVGLGIISYYLTELPITDEEYDPVASNIEVHNNVFQRQPLKTTMRGRMGKMLRFKLKFGKDVPHILWDGITGDAGDIGLCIRDNKNESFANIDAENDFNNISRDLGANNCSSRNSDRASIR